jgi:hypothetical protein
MERNLTGWELGDIGEQRASASTNITAGVTVPNTTARSGQFRLQIAVQGSASNLLAFPGASVTGTAVSPTLPAGTHKRFRGRFYLRVESTYMPFGNSQIRLCGLGGEFDTNSINVWMDATRALTVKVGPGLPAIGGGGYTTQPHTPPMAVGTWYRLLLDVDYAITSAVAVAVSLQVTTDASTPALDATVTDAGSFSTSDAMGAVTLLSERVRNTNDAAGTYSFDDLVWLAAAGAEGANPLTLPDATNVLGLAPTSMITAQWETGTVTNVDEYPLDTSGTGGAGDTLSSVLGDGTTVVFGHASSAALGIIGAAAVKVSGNARITGSGTGAVDFLLTGTPTSRVLQTQYPAVASGVTPVGGQDWSGLRANHFDSMTFGVTKRNGTQQTSLGNIIVEYLPATATTFAGAAQIRGTTQIKPGTITDPQISATAGIKLSKLEKAVVAADGSVPLTADLPLGGHKLTGVADPGAAQDAATKAYVDAHAPTGVILANGSVPFAADESMAGHKLTNVTDPVNPQDAATKAYVDGHAAGGAPGTFNETPGGAVNGANTAFTTAVAYASGTLRVYVNGVRLAPADYTETGAAAFTLGTAPATGDLLRVDYNFVTGVVGTALTGTFAARPAAATSGRLYLPTDGFSIDRDNGASWDAWGPLAPLIEPSDTGFSWINQGASTIAIDRGRLTLRGAGTSGGTNWALRVKTLPAAPYTVTYRFLPPVFCKLFLGYGLVVRQVGAGTGQNRFVALWWSLGNFAGADAGGIIRCEKWTSPTVVSASYIEQRAITPPQWFRVQDDGTNLILSVSGDGATWVTLLTVARLDFMLQGADQFGFGVFTMNNAAPNLDVPITLVSLAVTTP